MLPEHLYKPDGEPTVQPAGEEPVKRRGRTLALCLLLVLIGAGSAFLWHYYSGSLSEPAISRLDEISQLKTTLQGLQSQQGAEVQRNQEMLQAQQADIKRLSEEVAQLTAKLDLLQSSARDAEAAIPPTHKPPPKKPAPKSP